MELNKYRFRIIEDNSGEEKKILVFTDTLNEAWLDVEKYYPLFTDTLNEAWLDVEKYYPPEEYELECLG